MRKKIRQTEDENYNTVVGENGELIKIKEEVKVVVEEKQEDIPILKEIRLGKFTDKSQFIAIILSVFGGLIALHDFYLGLKKRGIFRIGLLGVSMICSYVLFQIVSSEALIGYNYFFQIGLMLPILLSVLWWSYDAMTIISMNGKKFKMKKRMLDRDALDKKRK